MRYLILIVFNLIALFQSIFCQEQSPYDVEHHVVAYGLKCNDDFCDKVTITIHAADTDYELHLVKNNYLFSNNYKPESTREGAATLTDCYYSLKNRDDSEKWAAISLCRNHLSGAFAVGPGKTFELKFNSDTNQTFLYDVNNFPKINQGCGIKDARVPSTNVLTPEFQVRSGTLPKIFIKLLLVNSFLSYSKYFKSNIQSLTDYNQQIIHRMNIIYEPLRVHFFLIGIETWTDKEEIPTIYDAVSTNRLFGDYAAATYHDRYNYDIALLHYGYTFNTDTVGIATISSICLKSPSSRSGVVTYINRFQQIRPDSSLVQTAAHEVAHLLGLDHINVVTNPNCKCSVHPKGSCIMSPSSDGIATGWSECSKSELKNIHGKGDTTCVMTKPNDFVYARAICGNGVVEDVEQCDCDHGDIHCHACCDASTCKLKSSSTCASGECCANCKLMSLGTQCSVYGADPQCNLPSTCDGIRPKCPLGNYHPDLTPCRDNSFVGNCFEGRCVSRGGHCQAIFGPWVRPSRNAIYNRNTNGTTLRGHCGKDRNHVIPCNPVDVLCGQIRCEVDDYQNHAEEIAEIAVKKGAHTIANFEFLSDLKVSHLSITYDTSDYHLTPEGMSCGNNKICSDVKCLPVGCQENCNGQGRCVSGKCVCNRGFNGPFCKKPCPSNCNRHGFCAKDGNCGCLDGFFPPSCTSLRPIVNPSTTTTRRTTTTPRKTTTTKRTTTTPKRTTNTKRTTTTTTSPTNSKTTSRPSTSTTPLTTRGMSSTRDSTNSPTTSSTPVDPSSSTPLTTSNATSSRDSSTLPPFNASDKKNIIIAAIIVVVFVVIGSVMSWLYFSLKKKPKTTTTSSASKKPLIRKRISPSTSVLQKSGLKSSTRSKN